MRVKFSYGARDRCFAFRVVDFIASLFPHDLCKYGRYFCLILSLFMLFWLVLVVNNVMNCLFGCVLLIDLVWLGLVWMLINVIEFLMS